MKAILTKPVFPEGPPTWPVDDEDVLEALVAAYRDGSWGRYHGPHAASLRERLAEMHGAEHVTLCSSGTVAVELALRGLNVGPDDEVILAGYDFPGNFRAIEAVGARPVLVDIDADNWCLDPEHFQAARSGRTTAIIVSHLHGGLAPMSAIMRFAKEHAICVVEDACQNPGAVVEGRPAGAWGDAGVLSFGGSKLLTAGRGGAVLTSSAELYQRMKVYSHRGNDVFPLSELQAAVLMPQLDKLGERNRKRAASVRRILANTADISSLRPLTNPVEGEPSYYKLPWMYETTGQSVLSRDDAIAAIAAEGLAIDSGFRGFASRSANRCRKVGELDASRRAAASTLLLHHPILLSEDKCVDGVAQTLAKVLGEQHD